MNAASSGDQLAAVNEPEAILAQIAELRRQQGGETPEADRATRAARATGSTSSFAAPGS